MRVTNRPIVTALLSALTAPAVAAGAHAAVFGRDDRAPAQAEAAAHAVGTLARRDAAPFCSAFCVAPGIIATAGHCLNGSDIAAPENLARVIFRLPASREQSPLAGFTIGNMRQNIVSGAGRLRTKPPIAASTDWAVAKLARPVCSGRVLPLSARSNAGLLQAANAGRIDQIAFHRDRPDAELLVARGCRTIAFTNPRVIARHFTAQGTLYFHDCDTGSGSSGSPLLTTGPAGTGEAKAVAINVGTYVLAKGMIAAGGIADDSKSKAVANTAVRSAAVAPAIDELKSRDLLDTPTEIRRLERALKHLGFYRAPIIGCANATLMNAVRDFELSKGRKPTGLLRRALLKETWDEMNR